MTWLIYSWDIVNKIIVIVIVGLCLRIIMWFWAGNWLVILLFVCLYYFVDWSRIRTIRDSNLFYVRIFETARISYRYIRVLLSELKIYFDADTNKKHPDTIPPCWWRNKENNDDNQNQQMRAQKNRMDPPIIELLFLKSKVDFELLWRCISKILRTTRRRCMRGGFLKFEQ